ncbi:hypothetical protein C8F04DRAFT_885317, partial [Mycena alexandri]
PGSWEGDLEEKYTEGCRILHSMLNPNYTSVARQLNINLHTLRRRFLGQTRPRPEAHQGQMLLSPLAEEAVVDWILYLASTGHPVDKRGIRSIVKDVCSKHSAD